MKQNHIYLTVIVFSTIGIVAAAYGFSRAAQNKAPEITNGKLDSAVIDTLEVSDTENIEIPNNKELSLDTCPPGKHGDLSPNSMAVTPEPTLFEEEKPDVLQNMGELKNVGITLEQDTMLDLYPPQDLKLQRGEGTTVHGSWSHTGQTYVKQFNVYMRQNEGAWQYVGNIPVNATGTYTFTDTGTKQTGEYSYALTAFGKNGVESTCSNMADISF